MSDTVWYEDGPNSEGMCLAGSLCDDAAGRSWPEPAPSTAPSGWDILLLALVVWIAISATFTALAVALRGFRD